MTVKELMEQLSKLDESARVMIEAVLAGVDDICPDSIQHTPVVIDYGQAEEDEIEDAEPIKCGYPVSEQEVHIESNKNPGPCPVSQKGKS